jgi:type IV pilus assembly protein PilB
MPISEEIERMTLARAPASDLKRAAISGGMTTLRHDGLLKVVAGETTLDEVIRVTV